MSDSTLNLLVYFQALLMLVSGALIIANVRIGGLGLFLSMAIMVATRDNPVLAVNEHTSRAHFINMLKDLGVAGMGLLIYNRRQTVKHRSPAATGSVSPPKSVTAAPFIQRTAN